MKHIGRQPVTVVVNPSRGYPWYGMILGEVTKDMAGVYGGERLTQQQALALDRLGLAQDTETMTVYRQATDREMWWGTGAPPVFEFQCPILGTRKGGARGVDKIKVLAPNGDAKLVFPDGWVARPHRLNRGYIAARKAGQI